MKTFLSLAFSFSLLAGLTAQEAPRPNIVFMLADDFGYGDTQCLNPERGKNLLMTASY